MKFWFLILWLSGGVPIEAPYPTLAICEAQRVEWSQLLGAAVSRCIYRAANDFAMEK
jgi:hypothetical protein